MTKWSNPSLDFAIEFHRRYSSNTSRTRLKVRPGLIFILSNQPGELGQHVSFMGDGVHVI